MAGLWHSPELPSLIVRLMRERGLTDEQIVSALEVVGEVCPYCRDEYVDRCVCMRDD